MRQTSVSIAVLLLLVGLVVAAPAAAIVGSGQGDVDSVEDSVASHGSDDNVARNVTSNQTGNDSIAPGAHLSGVVGVQKAEIDGEIESRGLGIALRNAKTNESKAEVLANETNRIRERIQSLTHQQQALKEALKNGSITKSQYQAEIAEVATRSATVRRLANQTVNASGELPEQLREAKGINETALHQLRTNARNLTGQEVAAIARSIGGPGIGQGLGNGPPAHANKSGSPAGPPSNERSPDRDTNRGPGNDNVSQGNETSQGPMSPDADIRTDNETIPPGQNESTVP